MNRLISYAGYLILAALLFGCSGSGGSPVTPSGLPDPGLTGQDSTSGRDMAAGHALWGLWQAAFDPEKGAFELVSLREAQFHVNVTRYLQPPSPPGLAIVLNSFDPVAGTVDLDLTITHPFPNSNLRGFDVRGIVMGAGDTLQSSLDAGVIYPAPGGLRLENTDGYTRWWNAVEFTTPGLYGFTPGALGFKNFSPKTTVNPYKYFADALAPTDPVVPGVKLANRGTFSTDATPPALTRNYKLRFPMGTSGKPIWLFQYAIDASWAPPTGGSPKPKPIGDFPIEANCPEAFHIVVDTEGTTAWYVDDSNRGGNLVLSIEVFDWGAPSNPQGIVGEIQSIFAESPTLFGSIETVNLTPSPGSQPTSGIFKVTVPNVTPTDLEDQEVLITVRSKNPTAYAPPVSGPAYPTGASLAAYGLAEVPISNIQPQEAKITVVTPNGGEEWEQGGSEEIEWLSDGPVGDYVSIAYTISDATPTPIVDSTENDSSFTWDPIPPVESDEVRIVVTSVDDPEVWDQSDEFFTITAPPEPKITVTVPNGGEVWQSGGAQHIKWTSEGDVGAEVKIEYTVEDGAPTTIAAFAYNNGDFFWVPIPVIESDKVKIVITSLDNPLIFDESDDYFTVMVNPSPTIKVVVPNGGEIWEAGGAEEITWTSVGDVGPQVRIDYTVAFGFPINIVSMTDNDGTFMWDPLPDIESDLVKVWVFSLINPMVFDVSDDYFTIASNPEPLLTITVPNGGEVWEAGSAEEITWTSIGPVGDFVKLEYQAEFGVPQLIAASTENDESFIWDPIPDIASDHVKVIITSIDDPGVWDESDDFFTIEPPDEPKITVVVPNGGEVWVVGSSEEIAWNSFGAVGDFVKIEYSLSDGLPAPITASTDNDGNFDWDPIPDIESDQVRVIITSIDVPTVSDSSDDYFTITEQKTLTLSSPNGGEMLTAGGSWEITWSWTGSIDFVTLRLSTDSGSSYLTEIVASTDNDGSFEWNPIPDIETSTARVKVEWSTDPGVFDESDSDFSIVEEQLTGWNPIDGLTGVALTAPAPDQGSQPEDIMLYSEGADQSRGEIVDGTADNTFWKYANDYLSTTGTNWEYPVAIEPLHKFDVLPDGSYVFVTNANTESYAPPLLNDPTYALFSANDNSTGEFSDGYLHFYGDWGDPSDPEEIPWRWVVDFSCGVVGGVNDTRAYHFFVHSPDPDNPFAHNGRIGLLYWDAPYDNTSTAGWLANTSTQGGGLGLVDDTDPESMALAADDDTSLSINGETDVTTMWILDSVGHVQAHVIAWPTGDSVYVDNQLDSEKYGTALPVDIEVAPAKAFGFEVTDPGFNWLVALLDNGDGTWSLGVWEFSYLADPTEFVEIDITDPLPGVPLAVDVDNTDFEIHVLADNAGTVEATVFAYTP